MVAVECEYCGNRARYGIEDRCRACQYPVAQWAPNVQLAVRSEHADGLTRSYEQARLEAGSKGLAAVVDALESLLRHSRAVVSMPVPVAYDLITREHYLYAPYAALVKSRVRGPAEHEDDRRRRAVDSLLYGSFAESVIFAALSTDGVGVHSYGRVHVQLKERAVGYRSTVLIENSYSFVERHRLTPGATLPTACLAPWSERGKLGVVKLSSRLHAGMSSADMSKLILSATDSRAADDFLEVHIYGPFNRETVERIHLSSPDPRSPRGAVDDVLASALEAHVRTLGIAWSQT